MPALALEGGLIQSSTHSHQIQVHLQAITIIALVVNTINEFAALNTWFAAFSILMWSSKFVDA